MSKCVYVFLYVCHVTFSRPLIGQKWECYIVEEVIDVDELDEGYLISASLASLDLLNVKVKVKVKTDKKFWNSRSLPDLSEV